MYNRTKKGLTLVELLLVVVILGVIATIAIPRISASSDTAKRNSCATNVDIMNSQAELYRADTGSYPASLNALVTDPNYFPEGLPVCPSGGTYTMTGNPPRVSCDADGH